MKKPNIFWILTDGTRYKKGRDRYGRLPIYYEFDKESISFKKAIATATSTLMSVSSILTGRFAAELYPHFKYMSKNGLIYPTYIEKLKQNGYKVNATIFNNSAGRRLFKDILGSCVDKFPIDTVKDGNNSFTEFKYMMEHRFDKNKPNLVFVHMGWYTDNTTAVKNVLNYLKRKGLYDDAIIITSSDHGYVDYGRYHNIGWAMQPKTHSLYVDENSYRANLNIKLPESLSKIKTKAIETPVCLIDMFETLFDYMGLKHETTNKKALSLKPLIEKDDKNIIEKFKRRVLRVDNRYIFQNYREIRLINDYYTTVLFSPKDIKKLPASFKKEFLKMEGELKETCLDMLDNRFKASEISKLNKKKIAIYNYNHKDFISYVYKKLSKNNKVSVLDLETIKKDYRKYDLVIAFVDNPYFYMYGGLHKFCSKKKIELLLLDNFFDKVDYKNYHYLIENYNDPGMKTNNGFILKCGLYVIMLYLKLKETVVLGYIKDNYHPVIKNI